MAAFIPGFFLSLGLIGAIGAQNAFVLRQGIRQEHVLSVALTCALSDAVLVTAGVAGAGTVLGAWPWIDPVFRYGGALFLVVYGLSCVRRALRGGGHLTPAESPPKALAATLAVCLAFTWLNPHVYLDTVVLIGSVSTQYADQKVHFALGAISASFVFFLTLGYGARFLRPVMARPAAWRVFDVMTALVMWTIAVKLVL